MLSSRYVVRVGWGDCDPMGIVYNPNYLDWFDRAVHALLRQAGIDIRSLLPDGLPLVETKLRFLAPSSYGDEIVVVSEVLELHRCAFDLRHRAFNGGTLGVEAAETRVYTSRDAETGRIKAAPLPQALIRGLTGQEAGQPGMDSAGPSSR